MHSCGSAGRAAGNLFPFTKIKNIHTVTKAQSAATFVQQHWFMIPGAHTRPLKSGERTYRSFSCDSQETFVLRNEFIHTESARNGCWKWSLLCNFLLGAEEWATSLDFLWIIQSTKQPHTLCSMHLASSSSAFSSPHNQSRGVQIMHFLLQLHFSWISQRKPARKSLVLKNIPTWHLIYQHNF